MAKIYELLAKKNVSGDLGVEIEAEGARLPFTYEEYWEMKNDNSLRGNFPETACEYVMPKPKTLGKTLEGIKYLIGKGEENKTKWVFSFRTSCHVHLNVLDLEEEQLKALAYLYLLLEEPLMNYCGKTRKHNRFCLRTQDAENTIEVVNHLITQGVKSFVRSFDDGQIRYAAFNLGALKKYGSVEFRGMRGTLDYGVLSNWVSGIMRLKEYVQKHTTIQDVYTRFVDQSPEDFIKEVFGDIAHVFLYKGVEYDMRLSFSITMEIPMGYKAIQNAKPKTEKLNMVFDDLMKEEHLRALFEGVPAAAPQPRPRRIVPRGDVALNLVIQE